MKKLLLITALIIFVVPFAYSAEAKIEQNKPIETVRYIFSIDDEDESTLDNHENKQEQENYLKSEVELKGTVIYDEGVNHINEIDLEEIEKPQINLKTPQMVIPVRTEKIKTSGIYMPDRSALSNASRLSGEEYMIAPVWSYITEQTGNFSYGTFYSSGIDNCQLQSTMNLFTRYDFKHFAITGAIGTNESNVEGSRDEKVIQFAPEIKLSKSFVIRDTVQAYVNENYKKNKISIIYTPQWKNHPDILRFELGFSNTYYSEGRIRSAVEFSTRIRF